jgi:hypothetical protein
MSSNLSVDRVYNNVLSMSYYGNYMSIFWCAFKFLLKAADEESIRRFDCERSTRQAAEQKHEQRKK